MIKVTGTDGIKYIVADGERYWPEEALKNALSCKDDDIFGEIKKLKEERDNLKDKVRRLKVEANSRYGASCGYSSDDTPVFKTASFVNCSFSHVGGQNAEIEATFTLYPNANYKGSFGTQNFADYITHYDERKVKSQFASCCETVDYANAKRARAELCDIWKHVTGADKIPYDVTPTKMKRDIQDAYEKLDAFRDNVCEAISTTTAVSDYFILNRIRKLDLDHKEIYEKYYRYCLAIGSLCSIPEEHREDISWIEDAFKQTRDDYRKRGEELKVTRKFRTDIWEAMGKKPDALPEENSRIISEVAELSRNEKLLIEFRDGVAKAIDTTVYATNNVLLNSVQYICKDRKDVYEIVSELYDQISALSKANEALQQQFEFQNGLRKQWHERYESEHERANGVQKCLDKTREALHVKNISLETAKKEYQKVCDNLVTAQAAIDGFKKKVRELQADTTEAEHPIDTDPGYLRAGEDVDE